MNFIFGIVVAFLIISIINNVINLFFDYKEDNVKSKRLNQMKKMKTKEDVKFKDIMDIIANTSTKGLMPRLRKLFPSIGKIDMMMLDRDLKLSGWDDTFTPETFISSVWGLRVGGTILLVLGLLFFKEALRLLFVCFGLLGIFGLEMYLKSEVKSIKDELFAEFPDFIRIVSGYLSADIPLVQSITDSIKYVGDAWEPILKTFVIDCDNKSIDFALDRMKNTVDLFEVKEFVSLIKLTLEQGGKAKDGFLSQADKIEELQKNQLVLKVGKRKVYGQLVQAPLLLINMVIISLPTISQAMSMFSGGAMNIGSITS